MDRSDQNFKRVIESVLEIVEETKKGKQCAICLGEWQTQKRHRAVTLPCGHVFGRKCLIRYASDRLWSESDQHYRYFLRDDLKCPMCRHECFVSEMKKVNLHGMTPCGLLKAKIDELVKAVDALEKRKTTALERAARQLEIMCSLQKMVDEKSLTWPKLFVAVVNSPK